jgi:ATP-dependent Clp protease adaptor protein ClpS
VVLPTPAETEQDQPESTKEPGYLVICWNDPINLMDYVTHVFQVVFGWARQKAEHHMLQVHEQGKSVLTRDSLEKAEHYVHQLQKYSLHATMERDE